jgi:hypothetical protein
MVGYHFYRILVSRKLRCKIWEVRCKLADSSAAKTTPSALNLQAKKFPEFEQWLRNRQMVTAAEGGLKKYSNVIGFTNLDPQLPAHVSSETHPANPYEEAEEGVVVRITYSMGNGKLPLST